MNAEWGTLDAAAAAPKAGVQNSRPTNPFLINNSNNKFDLFSRPSNNNWSSVPPPQAIAIASNSPQSPSHTTFAPPPERSALKKQSISPPQGIIQHQQRRINFRPSVDVRVSLHEPGDADKMWHTASEIKAMRANAMNKYSQLRHSHQLARPSLGGTPGAAGGVGAIASGAGKGALSSQMRQLILMSPDSSDSLKNRAVPQEHTSSLLSSSSLSRQMPRVHSAAAQLNAEPSSNPQDIRYQKLISELDKEVYITNEERRNSTRRRLHHYSKVLDDIDRQCDEGYTMINVAELAHASRLASGDAYHQALERARREETLAKAVLMLGSSRR